MTFDQWAHSRKQPEAMAYLDRNPKGYFEAMDLLDKIAKLLGRN